MRLYKISPGNRMYKNLQNDPSYDETDDHDLSIHIEDAKRYIKHVQDTLIELNI